MVHVVKVRADATRNRARILAAARELLARDGDATMEDVATRAGVAVGTLYRHFPSKTDLVVATLEQSAQALAELAESALARARAGSPPGQVLGELLGRIVEQHTADKMVKEVAISLGVPATLEELTVDPDGPGARAAAAADALLALARGSGEFRPDVTLADLLLFLSLMPGPDHPQQARLRYVEVVLAGLVSPR